MLVAAPLVFRAAPAAGQATTHASSRVPAAKAAVVKVTLGRPSEYTITISTHSVPAGQVTFKVTNRGTVTNDFKICTRATKSTSYPNSCVGKSTGPLEPGASATFTVTLTRGIHQFLCSVPGHAVVGMKGAIGVGVKAPGTTAAVRAVRCASPQTTNVAVDEFEYGYTLTPSTVPCGTVIFNMTNSGGETHNFSITRAPTLKPVGQFLDFTHGGTLMNVGEYLTAGGSATMKVVLAPGTYGYVCDVGGHAPAGMLGALEVTNG